MKKLFLILLTLFVAGDIAYAVLSHVTFTDFRGHVSDTYCQFLAPKAKLAKPVIFIPGIKGSFLSSNNQLLWLPLLGTLPGENVLMFAPNDTVVATGVFTRVALIPGLLQSAPYQRISAQLACQPNAYFFYYDWRRQPAENVAKLSILVDRVIDETGENPSIVAHSLGGLITDVYLKEHPNHVNKVVYVGVPFAPGTSFVEDILNGSTVGLNKTLLSPEAVFSHPASFALLPHAGQMLYKGRDLMDPKTWSELKLGAFGTHISDLAAFTVMLDGIKKFHAALDAPKTFKNKFLFVVGNCTQTEASVDEKGTAVTALGDGRVTEKSAYPVEMGKLDNTVIHSCAEHSKQLNDPAVVGSIFKFLSE